MAARLTRLLSALTDRSTELPAQPCAGCTGSTPRKVRFANEQMSLHLDILFAKGFFHSGVWGDEWQGTDSNPTGKKFLKFNDANFDPVHFFDERRRDIKRRGAASLTV